MVFKGYIYFPKANGLGIIESKEEAAKEFASDRDGFNLQIKKKPKWLGWRSMDKKWFIRKAPSILKMYGI